MERERDIAPVEFLAHVDDNAMKVFLHLAERTLQGSDVELFGESFYTFVQVFQLRFDAQQTLLQRLEKQQ